MTKLRRSVQRPGKRTPDVGLNLGVLPQRASSTTGQPRLQRPWQRTGDMGWNLGIVLDPVT